MVKLALKVNITKNSARVVPIIEKINNKPNKRGRAWVLSLLMFAESCIMLEGCSTNNNIPQSTSPPTISSTKPVADETVQIPLETEPVYDETIPIPWEERVLPFLERLEQVPIKYKYEEDYPSESDIHAQMSNIETTKTQCDYKYSGGLYEVWNGILHSTVEYVNKNKDCEFPFMTIDEEDTLSNKDKVAFEKALEQVIEKLLTSSTNNFEEDICTLKDYAIVYSYEEPDDYGPLATTYPAEKLIKIYPNRIRKEAEELGISFEQELTETLEHEINHVKSLICDCREEAGQAYNSVGNYALDEASAESYIKYTESTVIEVEDQFYYFERRSESLLLALGLFRNVDAEDYYNAIHDCDAYDYCRFFGINPESEEELKRFGNIFYSIDAINTYNYLFWSHFEEKTASIDEIVMTVGQTYKADILKEVLANMMNYTIANEDFSLTDNIVIFKTLLSIVVQEHNGSSVSPITILYEPDFFKTVINLYDIYLDFLSEYYGIPKGKIRIQEQEDSMQRKINALSKICSEQDYPDSEEKEYATNLIERFPLLKQILIMYPLTLNEWEDFITIHEGSLAESPKNTNDEYRLATPSFIDASSSKFKFAPSREEIRHPGTTIDTEVVNTALVQACFNSKQHERILNKTAVKQGQGKVIKYTNANPSLARFAKAKRNPHHI